MEIAQIKPEHVSLCWQSDAIEKRLSVPPAMFFPARGRYGVKSQNANDLDKELHVRAHLTRDIPANFEPIRSAFSTSP